MKYLTSKVKSEAKKNEMNWTNLEDEEAFKRPEEHKLTLKEAIQQQEEQQRPILQLKVTNFCQR